MRAFVFDFDYTLGDSSDGIVISVNHALECLGYPYAEPTKIKKTIGLSLADTFITLTGSECRDRADEFSLRFKEMADRVMVDNTILYPDVSQLLNFLKCNGYKVAIVTSKFHYRIEQILAKFGMSSYVDVIVGAEDVSAHKPAPDPLNAAIGLLDISKEEVIYVGDNAVDAMCAGAAGARFVAVLTGTTTADDFRKLGADIIFDNISKFLEYMKLRMEHNE